MRTGRLLLFLGAAIAALLVFELITLCLLWRRAGKQVSVSRSWITIAARDRPPARFIWSGTAKQALPADSRLRFRLEGETGVLRLRIDGTEAVAAWDSGAGREAILARTDRWSPLKSGEVLHIAKSPGWLGVFRGNERVLAGPCPAERFSSGVWQFSGPRGPESASGAAPLDVRFQKTVPPYFADDFMHGEGALGEWQVVSGDWTVSALDNPIRSANAFSFWGRGKSALATVGYWFWRNYQVTCSVHPLDPVRFGVLLCYADNGQAYRLDWEGPSEKGARGRLRLVKTGGASETVLAEVPMGFVRAQWYRVKVRQFEGVLQVWIDDVPVLAAVDSVPLLGGRFGLWSQGGGGVVFDDVELAPSTGFALRFPVAAKEWPLFLRPVAAAEQSSATNGLDLSAVGGRLDAVVPLLDSVAFRVGCAGLNTLRGKLELEVRRGGGERRVFFRVAPAPGGGGSRAEIGEAGVAGGVRKSVPLPHLASTAELSLHADGAAAWACVDDRIVAWISGLHVLRPGACGLAAPEGAAGLRIRRLEVSPQQPLPEIENWVETFAHEESMQAWGDPESEWLPRKEMDGRTAFWHRSDFWNDFSARLDLGTSSAGAATWGLVLAGGDPETVASRCWLAARRQGAGAVLSLDVTGEPRREKKFAGPVSRIALGRRQGRLVILADGVPVWEGPLPEFLLGLVRIGRFGGTPSQAWARAVHIGALGVRTWSFKQAPADWAPATGVWEVTNRWQCDPRWSFFAGVKRGGPACIWNKRLHGENVTLEFFAGPKMDMARGRRYEYAADLNAVICADGVNIDSGYSFMLGGWNDTGSYLVRGRDVLARASWAVIPRSGSTHHRWFYIKFRKAGNRLTVWLDGKKVADREDPRPLTGRHLGLWTWDNGMMVAQVRVSTDSALVPAAVLEKRPGTPETPYAKKR
ncbi:MAG: hypothetical protein GXP31_13060 [Kiritimatiellaeota bacterium]|nr:hypothetical protein [Kiritimatiellota bacterium]